MRAKLLHTILTYSNMEFERHREAKKNVYNVYVSKYDGVNWDIYYHLNIANFTQWLNDTTRAFETIIEFQYWDLLFQLYNNAFDSSIIEFVLHLQQHECNCNLYYDYIVLAYQFNNYIYGLEQVIESFKNIDMAQLNKYNKNITYLKQMQQYIINTLHQ